MTSIQRYLAAVLCFLISPVPAALAAPADTAPAGQINALIPAATLNAKTAKAKDSLQWNDLLKTEHTGRLRVALTDGSMLSLGSDSQLKVVQHDTATQQTALEMNFGKIRSQVVKVTQPGGKFEVKTPNAVIGVIGTDFYVGYGNNQTTVICYTGKVWVSPSGNAKVVKKPEDAGAAEGTILLSAGQMVVISDAPPVGGFLSGPTPLVAQQMSIEETELQPPAGVAAHGSTHLLRNILLGTGIAAAVAGAAVAVDVWNGKPCRINRQTGKCG